MLKKIGNAVCNVFFYKIALMVMLIPTLLVFCNGFNYRLLMVMLVWGAIVCLYDFFIRRTFVTARGILWIVGFLVVFFISVLINLSTGFSGNITSWGYSVIALFLLYPDGAAKDRPTVLRELSVINTIFIGMTTVLSTISLGMFVIQYSKVMWFDGQKYYIGWEQNRLFGLYANTGYMITAIGIAVIAIQWAVLRARKGRVSVPAKIFLIYTAVVNYLCMCMENAKGAFLSLAAFLAVGALFLVLRWFFSRGKKKWIGVCAAFFAACASVGLFFGAVAVTRPTLAYVPAIYWDLKTQPTIQKEPAAKPEMPSAPQTTAPAETEFSPTTTESAPAEPTPTEPKKEPIQAINIDRDIDESYGALTGRPRIWEFGLQEFLKKPILGYGPQSHREVYIVDNYLRHFHNLIVQTLVSVGSVGSLFIFGFFIAVFLFLLEKLFVLVSEKNQTYSVAALLMALFAMLIVNSMAEVTILFIARFAMFMFWMYLGYAVALLSDGEKAPGNRFLEKMNGAVNERLGKKRI